MQKKPHQNKIQNDPEFNLCQKQYVSAIQWMTRTVPPWDSPWSNDVYTWSKIFSRNLLKKAIPQLKSISTWLRFWLPKVFPCSQTKIKIKSEFVIGFVLTPVRNQNFWQTEPKSFWFNLCRAGRNGLINDTNLGLVKKRANFIPEEQWRCWWSNIIPRTQQFNLQDN